MPRVGDPTSSITPSSPIASCPACRCRRRSGNHGIGGEFRPLLQAARGHGRGKRPWAYNRCSDRACRRCRTRRFAFGPEALPLAPPPWWTVRMKLNKRCPGGPSRQEGQQRLLDHRPCQRRRLQGGSRGEARTGKTLAQALTKASQGGKPTGGAIRGAIRGAEKGTNIAISGSNASKGPARDGQPPLLIRLQSRPKVRPTFRTPEQWGRSRTTGRRGGCSRISPTDSLQPPATRAAMGSASRQQRR